MTTWKILGIEATGELITQARYFATITEGGLKVETEGNWFISEPKLTVPFADVTEDMIVSWIDKSGIEARAALVAPNVHTGDLKHGANRLYPNSNLQQQHGSRRAVGCKLGQQHVGIGTGHQHHRWQIVLQRQRQRHPGYCLEGDANQRGRHGFDFVHRGRPGVLRQRHNLDQIGDWRVRKVFV